MTQRILIVEDQPDICKLIHPALQHIKVIMLTARGQVSDLDAGQASGCDAYLVKPFSLLELIDRVEGLAGLVA